MDILSDAPIAELIRFEETPDGFRPVFEVRVPSQVIPGAILPELALREGIDYIVEGETDFEPGEHTAGIVFMGDFECVMAVSYNNPIQISSAMFDYNPLEYNGKAQTPTFTLRDGERELILGTDYELVGELQSQTSVCSHPIKFRGLGNYCGETQFRWIIRAVNLSKCELKLSAEETIYPEIPELTVTYGDIVLVPGVDYKVEAVQPEIGNAFMKLWGYGNFEGSRIVRWTMKLDLENMNTLVLPAFLKRIESEAFAGTNAQVIVIPATCEYVADDAFNDCEELQFIVNHSNAVITAPENVTVITEP